MNSLIEEIYNGNESEQAVRSIKLGLCRAISEHGLTPKQAEEILSQKLAFDFGKLVVEGGKGVGVLSALLGALVGVGTAAARNKFEQTVDNNEDPEMRQTKSKIDAYTRMVKDLKSNQQLRETDTSQVGTV